MKARALIASVLIGLGIASSAAAGTYVSINAPGVAIQHTSGYTSVGVVAGYPAPAYQRNVYPAYQPQYDGGHHRHHHHRHSHGVDYGRFAQPVYVAPAPVYVAPAPVYYARPVVSVEQQVQELYNMCRDDRTTRVCGMVGNQQACVVCNN